jgi:hypothetical protein
MTEPDQQPTSYIAKKDYKGENINVKKGEKISIEQYERLLFDEQENFDPFFGG